MDDRLKKFILLVETGNFTKTAASINISQPALSSVIKKLEQEWRVQLLVREGRQTKTTPAGQLLYTTAKDLEDTVRNLELRLSGLAMEKISLSLGMIDSMAEAVFVHNDGFEKLDAQAKVSLIVDNSKRLIAGVQQGEIDIAFITTQTKVLPGTLEIRQIGIEPLIMVTHAAQASQARRQLKQGVITNFISYNQGSNTNQLLQRTLSERSVAVQTIFYSSSPEIILRLLLSGRGVAALPYMLVRESLADGELQPLFIGGSCLIGRGICAVKRKNRQATKPLDDIMEHTRRVILDLHTQSKAYARIS